MSNVELQKTIFPLVNTIVPPYLANQHSPLENIPEDLYHVWLDTTCFAKIVSHVAQTPLEAGGIILGNVYFWREKYHIQIEAALQATQAEASWFGLRFTVEAWREMLSVKDRIYGDLVVVGWYHSHPLMHVGMSDWDITLHEGFFREPWQLSLITDPYRGVLGIFRTENFIPYQISSISVPKLDIDLNNNATHIGSEGGYLTYNPQTYPQNNPMNTSYYDEDSNAI